MTLSTHDFISQVFGATPVVIGYDCIHINIGSAPKGAQLAGYTTGSPDIRWTNTDWASHPGAVRIDQDFASDPSADVLDVERGAARNSDCPGWAKRAAADFDAVARAGQRKPAIYTSASNVTPVVNSLISGGVTSGVGLWVAKWDFSQPNAIREVQDAAGPFPIVAAQYGDGTWGDFDVYSATWLNDVSGATPPGPIAPNPVTGLAVTRRGFTSIDLAWDAPTGATSYTAKAYHHGTLVRTETTTVPEIRMRDLQPLHTYTFKVRAHPGGSTGADAAVNATTR